MNFLESQQGDVFMFLLYRVQQPTINGTAHSMPTEYDVSLLNHLIRRIVNRARTPDEYEINADEVWPIGGGGINILWYNLWWTIEDFLALLLAADDVELAKKNEAFLEDDRGQAILDEINKLPPDERFPLILLDDVQLAPWRVHLKCFLVWFACLNDTRIERLMCKVNNVLVNELNLGPPSVSKVLSLRRIVPNILKAHILGYCSWEELTKFMFDAYELGANNLSSVEDSPADSSVRVGDNEESGLLGSLFNCDMSTFGHVVDTHLVVRSSYPLSPQRTTLLAKPSIQYDHNDSSDEIDPPSPHPSDPMDVDVKE